MRVICDLDFFVCDNFVPLLLYEYVIICMAMAA